MFQQVLNVVEMVLDLQFTRHLFGATAICVCHGDELSCRNCSTQVFSVTPSERAHSIYPNSQFAHGPAPSSLSYPKCLGRCHCGLFLSIDFLTGDVKHMMMKYQL